MSKKILIVVTAVFFTAMLFLSVFSEAIHNAGLPKVTVSRPVTRTFEEAFTDENGKTQAFYTEKNALSEEQLENGVYVVYSAEKNGTRRSFVRQVQVVTGAEKDGYWEIVSGINYGEKIVTASTRELYDGAEVVVE